MAFLLLFFSLIFIIKFPFKNTSITWFTGEIHILVTIIAANAPEIKRF